MVAYLRSLGGTHTLDDFAAQRAEYVTPLATAYRGRSILQIPPNGQGLTALVLLNILAGYDLSSLQPTGSERQHLEVEASRLAYAVRAHYVGDPRAASFPLDHLLSPTYTPIFRSQTTCAPARNT